MKNYDIFLIFAQNIDCGYTLEPPQFRTAAVLTCSRNLCFREQETNAYIPLYNPKGVNVNEFNTSLIIILFMLNIAN